MPGPKFAPVELLSTSDGGKTFQIVTPPAAIEASSPPPEQLGVNGIVVKFPTRQLMIASRLRMPRPGEARRPPLSASAGGPMALRGSGFLVQNTVWFGSYAVQASSKEGEHLLFLVPQNLPIDTYPVPIENAHGNMDPIQVIFRPPESLQISAVDNHKIRFVPELPTPPRREINIFGSGFLVANIVWFGTKSVRSELLMSGGEFLRVEVPASVPPGPCDLYVTNANGRSNVVSVVVD